MYLIWECQGRGTLNRLYAQSSPRFALDYLRRRMRQGTGSWIGDAVYGVNDGLGTIFGIVSGVSGATLGNSKFVLLAGLAGMIASALSMGSGAYLASKSEREIYKTVRSWWASGLEMTLVGAAEGVITYLIGIGLGHLGG